MDTLVTIRNIHNTIITITIDLKIVNPTVALYRHCTTLAANIMER